MNSYAVFCGRFNPLHLGHEAVARRMIDEFGAERSCIVIGGSDAPRSPRDFFSASERKTFINTIFPEMRTIFAPTYVSDAQWMSALDEGLHELGIDPLCATYFAGSEEDAIFLVRAGRMLRIVSRIDGTTPTVSGGNVRAALHRGTSIAGMVNPLIHDTIFALYQSQSRVY